MPETVLVQDITKKPHTYENGKYRELLPEEQEFKEYPKALFHKDYVHEKVAGKEYGATESSVIVNSAEEEEELRAQGFGTLAETGIITAPDAKEVQKRKAISASDWRAAAGVPANDITDDHVKFLQANGRPDIQSVGDVYTLLSKFTGAQMKAFLVDTQNWLQSQAKAKAKAKAN